MYRTSSPSGLIPGQRCPLTFLAGDRDPCSDEYMTRMETGFDDVSHSATPEVAVVSRSEAYLEWVCRGRLRVFGECRGGP